MISTRYTRTFNPSAPDNVPRALPAATPQAALQVEQEPLKFERKPALLPLSSREQAVTRFRRSFAESDETLTLPGSVQLPALTRTQTAGDSELAQVFSPILTRVVGLSGGFPVIVDLPQDATFTPWWRYFYATFQSPDYMDWAQSIGLDTATVVYSPKDGSLSGKVHGQQTRFQPGDGSGWTQVAAPIWAASNVVAPHTTAVRTDNTFERDAAPFEAIADFYGEPLDVTPKEARTRADQIFQTKAFAPLDPNDFSRQPADRTPHMLKLHHDALARHRAEYAKRKSGDSQLAVDYARWLGSTSVSTQASSPNTLLRQHLYNSFQDQAYVIWAQQKGFDRTSAVFSAVDGSLSGLVNGKPERFTQSDNSGWREVSETQWALAKRVSPDAEALYADGLRSTPAGTQTALPQTSALKAWWQHFYTTFQDPAYVDWAQQKGFDRTSAVFSAVDGSLSGLVNGKLTCFTQDDDSGWAKVSTFMWDAAKVAAPGAEVIRTGSTFNSNAAPPEVIAAFYGEQHNLSPQEALKRSAELSGGETFTPLAANNALRQPAARSKEALEAQRQTLSASQQRYAKQTARAAGDTKLTDAFRVDLLAARGGHYRTSVYTAGIPQASSFGQAWRHFYDTLQSPDYLDWANKTGIDLSTVTVFAQDGCLSARINGELKQFTQTDNSGWAQVSGPIWKAAITVAPHTEALSTKPPFDADTAPFEVIADFYGEQHDVTPSQAVARAAQLATTPAFVPLDPKDPMRPPALRSLEGIERQREDLLKYRERYALQATADSELAVRYAAMFKYARAGEAPLEAQIAGISPNSLFGGWWQQLYAAFQSPEYVDWAKRNGIDTNTASFSPKDGTLTASVHGQLKTFTQAHNAEWAYISQPIWAAAKVAAPKVSVIHTDAAFKPNSVPFERVGEFYGEDPTLAGSEATTRAEAITTGKAFTDTDLDNPLMRPMDRTQTALEAQQTRLLERYERYTARKAGDTELTTAYANVLLAVQAGESSKNISLPIPVPADSTFGEWWRTFNDALQSPDFLAWVKEARLDPTELKLDPKNAALVAKVDGKEVKFTQHDPSGWAQVSGPIIEAGKLLVGSHQKLIDLTRLDNKHAPLLAVGQFYGESLVRDAAAAQRRALALQAGKAFAAPAQLAASSPQALAALQQTLANCADKHRLLVALSTLYTSAKDDPKVDITRRLKDTTMEVEPGSSFSNDNDMGLEDQTSLYDFLLRSGVSVPANLAQLANMIAVLGTPLAPPPANGNFWGLMSRSQPLSSLQKTRIQHISRSEAQTQGVTEGGLFNAFAQQNSGLTAPIAAQALQGQSNPEAILSRLVASPEAQALGQKLEASLSDISPASTLNERVLAALILDLDPDAGKKRNQVAGFDLAGRANWGHTPATIFQRLVDRLVTDKKIQREMAPAAAHLLLAGAAPAFLVRELPDDLRYGSHTWASLSAAVSRIEQSSPGASSRMTFEQVMRYGNTTAVTTASTIAEGNAQVDAAVDWAIAQGVIDKSDSEQYAPAQVSTALGALNKVIEESSQHADAFTQPIPSLRATALRILQETYGKQYDYTTPVAHIVTLEGEDSQLHSAVDLYIAGKLDSVRKTGLGAGVQIGSGKYIYNATALPNVKDVFNKEFNVYQKSALAALEYSIEQKITILPQEEQDRLHTHKIDLYALRQVNPDSPPALVDGTLSDSPARQGVILKVHGKTAQERATFYEYFPLQGVFRKRDDFNTHFPDIHTPLRANESFSEGAFRDLTDGIPLNVDYTAYSLGGQPEDAKTANNIRIEKIVAGKFANVPQSKAQVSSYIARSIGNFLLDKQFWHGEDSVGKEQSAITARLEWMRKLYVPGMNTFEEFKQHGNTGTAQFSLLMDIFGFAFPAGKGGAQAARLTGRLGSKLFNSSKTVAKTVATAFKPAAGLNNALLGTARKVVSGVDAIGASAISPRTSAGSAPGHYFNLGSPISNFKPVIDGVVQTFDDVVKGNLRRLNIVVHGEDIPLYNKIMGIYDTPVSAVINNQRATPMELLRELRRAGINPADKTRYDTIRLLMCNSGNGGKGGISFAEKFKELIGDRPLKAFQGSVGASTAYVPEGFVHQVNALAQHVPNANPAIVRQAVIANYSNGIIPLSIGKTNRFSLNPFKPNFSPRDFSTFVYRPIHV